MKMTVSEFKKYYESYYKDEILDEEEIRNEIEGWEYYRKKIVDRILTGFEYNSKKENFNYDDDFYSLEYFIERETNGVGSFGSVISGKLVLWIEDSGNNAVWHDKRDGDKVLTTEAEKDDLLNEVRTYLYKIVTSYSFDDLIGFIEGNSNENLTKYYGSPSFIEKMIIFDSFLDRLCESNEYSYDYKNKLIFIYDFNEIEKIELIENGKDLFDSVRQEKVNLKKNKMITEIVLRILEINNPTIYDLVRIQRCLWYLTKDRDRDIILSKEKKNIIFYGAPGTGKTYAVMKALSANTNIEYELVQFHPGFSYEDFIEGIKPVGMDKSGNLKFDVVNGCFKDFCIKAKNNPDKEFYFIADEINRANLSIVFGETLSLLENDYRWDGNVYNLRSTPLSKVIQQLYKEAEDAGDELKKQHIESLIFYKSSKGEVLFGIPQNVHFIGMMNDVDKSIDSFDLALRRRFVWIRKDFDEYALSNYLRDKGVKEKSRNEYINSCKNLNFYITGYKYGNTNIDKKTPLNLGKSFEFGHSIFMKIPDDCIGRGKILKGGKEVIWEEFIEPTLREYFRTSLTDAEIETSVANAREIFVNNN